MISERTLRNWRRDALKTNATTVESDVKEMAERILRLTQELMDLHLIKKG